MGSIHRSPPRFIPCGRRRGRLGVCASRTARAAPECQNGTARQVRTDGSSAGELGPHRGGSTLGYRSRRRDVANG